MTSFARFGAVALTAMFAVGLVGCGSTQSTFTDQFVGPIESAHGADAYRERQVLRYDIEVTFGGNVILAGTTLFDTNSERVRIDTVDGVTMVWDGAEAYVTPADAEVPGPPARFHLRTWTYFLAAPFKLRDPGSAMTPIEAPLASAPAVPAGKLTFGAGVGDAPDDWYIVFPDRETNRVEALAYIVTYSKSQAEAEQKPSIILYDGYRDFGGVWLSTDWTFHYWSPETGIDGEPKGTAVIKNVKFVTVPTELFSRPVNSRTDQLPPS